MQREKITVEKRTIAGKAVRKLRNQGVLPANVYGKDIKSTAVQLPLSDFKALYNQVHETGLVDLTLDGQLLPVLIHNVQWSPKTGDPVHADFFKVNLREKIASNIPVVTVGEPIAVKDKVGVLLTLMNEIEVEALPTELPEKIEIEVENLAQVGDQITVADVKAPQGVTILTDSSAVICKIDELVSREAEEEAAAEEAAAEAAESAEGEATEGAEGESTEKSESEEKPAEEGKE